MSFSSYQMTHQDEKGLKHVEQLTCSFLVGGFHALPNNRNHAREESLEGLDVGFVINIEVLSNCS
jgi:hypothetical protein